MQVVAYDTAANAGRRIEVLTERRGRGETRSHLVIDDARPDVDSGNYTCKPSIARPASIKVHVLESKLDESSAVQLISFRFWDLSIEGRREVRSEAQLSLSVGISCEEAWLINLPRSDIIGPFDEIITH